MGSLDVKTKAKLKELLDESPQELLILLLGDKILDMVEVSARAILVKAIQQPDFFNALVMDVAKEIPDPQDGEDGETPSKNDLTKLILPLIPNPKPGPRGKDAKITKKLMKEIANMVTPSPVVIEHEERPEITGMDIVRLINDLDKKSKDKIDASHIKNLPKGDKKDPREGKTLHRGGIKLIWNTVLDGTVNGSNKVFTVPTARPDPKDDRFIVEARGGFQSVDNGDFASSNKNRTITFVKAPPNGSSQPRIAIYHGK